MTEGSESPEERGMLEGSCLCGGVRYQIGAQLGPIVHCHCSQCRKASGASFSTNASVPAAAFRFVAGEDLVREFESSPGNLRCCGQHAGVGRAVPSALPVLALPCCGVGQGPS